MLDYPIVVRSLDDELLRGGPELTRVEAAVQRIAVGVAVIVQHAGEGIDDERAVLGERLHPECGIHEGQHTRGHTVVDWLGRSEQEPNANLVLELDNERFWELVQQAVR